ncbi:hypothetical protein PPE_06545 [Paenibacillus polymyxa E681]|nr:hypothetical protein PPE_06545 [Paenibacillus polymyxa E681]
MIRKKIKIAGERTYASFPAFWHGVIQIVDTLAVWGHIDKAA